MAIGHVLSVAGLILLLLIIQGCVLLASILRVAFQRATTHNGNMDQATIELQPTALKRLVLCHVYVSLLHSGYVLGMVLEMLFLPPYLNFVGIVLTLLTDHICDKYAPSMLNRIKERIQLSLPRSMIPTV